ATLDDLADQFRMPLARAHAALEAAGLVAVGVEGWPQPAFADPPALARLDSGGPRGRARPLLLSPFDSLVWHRPRTVRPFDSPHAIEAYVPAPRRIHGYSAMPLLAGGRLAGRVDPKRAGRTLVARRLTVRREAVEHLATALRSAAEWVGCDAVAVE